MNDNGKKMITLGIEGGGTKTTWALLDGEYRILAEGKVGPGNLDLVGREGISKLLREISKQLPVKPDAVGICLAACNLPSQKIEVAADARKIWPKATKVIAGEDTLSGFFGAHGNKDGILVISGTGSNTLGKKGSHILKAGGWGHVFSDEGSSYKIAVRALEAIYEEFNRTGKTLPLANALLKLGNAKDLPSLIPFIYSRHSKDHVASLAREVAVAAENGDKLALSILKKEAAALAFNVTLVAKRLGLKKPAIAVVGSMFEKRPIYFAMYKRAVRKLIETGDIFVSTTPGEIGAICFVLDTKIHARKKS